MKTNILIAMMVAGFTALTTICRAAGPPVPGPTANNPNNLAPGTPMRQPAPGPSTFNPNMSPSRPVAQPAPGANRNYQNGMIGITNNGTGYANTNSLPWTTHPPSGNPNGNVPGNYVPPPSQSSPPPARESTPSPEDTMTALANS